MVELRQRCTLTVTKRVTYNWASESLLASYTVDNYTVYWKVANYSLLQQTLTRPNSIRDTMETFVFGNNGFYNRHMFIANLGQT